MCPVSGPSAGSWSAEEGAGHYACVAAGPGFEPVPGRLAFAPFGQQAGRVAELAGILCIRPREPPDAADAPGAAMVGEHRASLVQLARLSLPAPLTTDLESRA